MVQRRGRRQRALTAEEVDCMQDVPVTFQTMAPEHWPAEVAASLRRCAEAVRTTWAAEVRMLPGVCEVRRQAAAISAELMRKNLESDGLIPLIMDSEVVARRARIACATWENLLSCPERTIYIPRKPGNYDPVLHLERGFYALERFGVVRFTLLDEQAERRAILLLDRGTRTPGICIFFSEIWSRAKGHFPLSIEIAEAVKGREEVRRFVHTHELGELQFEVSLTTQEMESRALVARYLEILGPAYSLRGGGPGAQDALQGRDYRTLSSELERLKFAACNDLPAVGVPRGNL